MALKIATSLALLLACVRAIDVTGLPSCGATCITDNINEQTACAPTDSSCLCGDKALGYDIGYCIGLSCDEADVQLSIQYVQNLCASFNSGGSGTTTVEPLVTAVTADATSSPTGVVVATTATGSTAKVTAVGSSGHSSSDSSENTENKHSGLSTAAKIGIGAGVPLGVLVIAGAVVLAFFLGRRKKSTPSEKDSSEEASTGQADPQPPNTSTAGATASDVVPQPPMTEVYVPPPMQPQPSTSPMASAVSTPQPTVVQPNYPQPQYQSPQPTAVQPNYPQPQYQSPQYQQPPVYNVAEAPSGTPSPNMAYTTPAYSAPPANTEGQALI